MPTVLFGSSASLEDVSNAPTHLTLAFAPEPVLAVIVTDHSTYDYKAIVKQAKLVVDTRNATKGIDAPNIVRC